MKIKKKITSFFICIFIFTLSVLMLLKPEICKESVVNALLLCGKIIIPSLFPFGVCVLFLMHSNLFLSCKGISPVTIKLFGLSGFPFMIFVFSLIGGYPIGAKLLNEAVEVGALSSEQAEKMLAYCVNAGPAFIISAVAGAILNSKEAGYILLFSQILSSLLICRFSGKISASSGMKKSDISLAENFVLSASQSADAVTGICFFIILFSVVGAYIQYLSGYIPFLKNFIYFTEITSAVTNTRNIYFIAFLLSFGGICIWCQIFSVAHSIKINILKFAAFRVLNGLLSGVVTFLSLKIFPVKTEVFSNISNIVTKPFVSSAALSVSLIMLGVIFIISLTNRTNPTKILEEIV